MEICKVASMCAKEGVKLHVYGTQAVRFDCNSSIGTVKSGYISERKKEKLIQQSPFTVAVQGTEHLRGNATYISDRLMSSIITHQRVMTNNPDARLLGVPVVTNMTSGCFGMYGDPKIILSNHTYAHRIVDLLSLFTGQ